jgi:hypothetical protein
VVELVPTTNISEKLYLCFLLKNQRFVNTEPNDIDNLINISIKPPQHYSPINFHLNPLIDKIQKKIFYKSGIDSVIIFIKPIAISEVDFTGYSTIPSSLFALYPVKNYNIIEMPKKEGFYGNILEGFTREKYSMSDFSSDIVSLKNNVNNIKLPSTSDNKNIPSDKPPGRGSRATAYTTYEDMTALDTEIIKAFENNLVTCTPVDDNDVSIVQDNTATYLMSSAKNNAIAQNVMKSTFLLTMTCLAISVTGSPFLFYYTVSKHITDGKVLTVSTIFVFCIFAILAISLISDALTIEDDEIHTGEAGGLLAILLFLSAFAVALSRALWSNTAPNFENIDSASDIKIIFSMFLTSFFDYKVIFIIIALMVACIIVMVPVIETGEYSDHMKTLIYGIGIPYSFIIITWGTILSQFGQF